MLRPASMGLDHALVVCDLTQIADNQCMIKARRSTSKHHVRFTNLAPKYVLTLLSQG